MLRVKSGQLRSDIVLSVNLALLGEVFADLVAVSCVIESERKFALSFLVEKVISTSTE